MLNANQPPRPKSKGWLRRRTARARKAMYTVQSSSLPFESSPGRSLPYRRSSPEIRLPSRRGSNFYFFLFANNLVHSLARKFEFVCNKSKRFATVMQLHYSRISGGICGRTWTQRAPLPSWNTFNFFNFGCGQLSLAAALTEVTNPGPQWLKSPVYVLQVGCGNQAVPLAFPERIDGCNC